MHILLRTFFLLVFLFPSTTFGWTASDTEDLLNMMKAAYEEVNDYQVNVEMKTRKKSGSFATKKVLYSFKKPCWIRLDFESPRQGTVLIYPDRKGKVMVRPSGLAKLFRPRFAPNSSLLKVAPGQRVDQTDLGLLISKITQSLTDRRRGQIAVSEEHGDLRVRVLADDHFREGVLTQYQFLIDTEMWFPIQVVESTPDGILERTVVFRDFKVNNGIPDSFFQLDKE